MLTALQNAISSYESQLQILRIKSIIKELGRIISQYSEQANYFFGNTNSQFRLNCALGTRTAKKLQLGLQNNTTVNLSQAELDPALNAHSELGKTVRSYLEMNLKPLQEIIKTNEAAVAKKIEIFKLVAGRIY